MAFSTIDEDLKGKVEEVIKCPICLENFRDPRILSCSHTFCCKCIKDAASHNHGMFQCPFRCGTRVANKDIDSLQVNLVIRDIVEVVEKNAALRNVKCCNCHEKLSELWCRICQNKGYCRECYDTLHQFPALSNHPPGESKPPKILLCDDHPTKEAEFWCKENKTPYCSTCLIEKRQIHKCELITDAVKETINQIRNKFDRHPLSTNPETELNELFTKYEEHSDLRKTNIGEIFTSLRRTIDEREKLINEKLSDIDVQNRKKLEDYHIELMSKCKRFRERALLFAQTVRAQDYIRILRDDDNYEEHFRRANEDWHGLKPPTLLEFNIEGLDQCQAMLKQSLENIRVVEKTPYENPQLEQMIVPQQNSSILNLNNQGLNDADTIVIAQELRTNMKTTILYLGNNQIKASGAKRIADSLRYNKTLSTLDLWSNQIGTVGAQHLANVLSNNTTVTELGLNANQIDDKGAQHFADILRENKTLAKLHLADNEIGDEGAKSLADMLTNNTTIKELHILQNKKISVNYRTQLEKQDKRLR